MKLKIILMLFLTFFSVLFFSGCMQLNISCGVDAENNVYLNYEIEIDISTYSDDDIISIKQTVDTATSYYRNLGFETGEKTIDNKIKAKAELRKTADNPLEAFALLQAILTDSTITPFAEISMDKISTEYEEGFYFYGILDLTHVISPENINDLPSTLADEVNTSMEKCSGTVSVELPGKLIAYDANSTQYSQTQVKIVKVDFAKAQHLSAQSYLEKNFQAIQRIKNESIFFIIVVILTVGVLIVGVVLFLYILIKKYKKKGLE